MRLNMTQQGGLADEFMSGGGSVINPLFLAADPAVPLGASTKQYVDNSAASLNANNLITGTIGAARFPAMNGDLTSSAGSTTLTLSNTGVTPGAYPKVSVDNKGRVLNGLNLVESDLPAMSWNKITSDKPTTIDGYGITNAIKSTGGTMVGTVSVNGTPTQSTQLVNKSYLDTVVGGTTGIAVGDIISKIDPSTPVGFLKCNGAELVKTSYQDLYNAIGDRYTTLTKPGNGKPWQNQYDINTENLGDLMSGRSVGTLPGTLGGAAVFVTKNRIYVYGGYNGSTYLGIGYTAAINNDGTLGAWSAATTLPSVYCFSTAIVTKNKVYLIGGYLNGSTATNAIFVADINADGTIGTWGNGPNLPATVSYSHAFINVNKLYVVGGYNGSPLNSLYSAEIKDDGSLTNWSTETNLPVTVYQSTLLVIKNKVYLIGGYQNSAASNVIYSAVLNSDGSIGTWTIDSYLPMTFVLHQGIVTRNVIYIFGGLQNDVASANIYKAEIRSDGSIGGWQLQTWTLQGPMSYTNVAVVKSKVYILGGNNGSAWTANCYVSDITGGLNDYSAFYSNVVETNFMVAGSGKPWKQQYQINTTQAADITGWVTDSSVLPTTLRFASVFVTKNRVHVLGGWNNTPLSTTYSAPINTDGTLGSWVAGSALPDTILAAQTVVISNKVYLIGGTNNTVYYSTVYVATINSDGTLGAWSAVNSLPGNLAQSQAIVTRNRIYLLGGHNGTTYQSVVYTASVYPDGSIGTWSAGTSLPIAVRYTQAVVTKNRVYLLGGYTDNINTVSTIYTAPINSDGTLGAWRTSGTLPVSLGNAQTYVTKTAVYLLGGSSNTTLFSTVYKATINVDGILGSFSAVTSIPSTLHCSSIIVTNNRIYLLGGAVDNTANSTSAIYSAPILEGSNDYSSYYADDTVNYMMPGSGKPWQQQYQINTTQSGDITGWATTTSLPISLRSAQTVVTKNRVYILGGWNSSNVPSSAVYTAPINSDGTLGTWVLDTALPATNVESQVIVTKNYVYLLGGITTSSVLVSTIYAAPINTNGTIGTWTSAGNLPVTLASFSAIITKKRIYVIGGRSAASTYVSTVYTAIINDNGTLGGWSTSPNSLPITIGYAQAIITKNRVYLCGGYNGSAVISSIYTALIVPDGTLGSWIAIFQNVSSSLTGVNSIVIPAGVTNITVVGQGGSGTSSAGYWGSPAFANVIGWPPTLSGYPPPASIQVATLGGQIFIDRVAYDYTSAIYRSVDPESGTVFSVSYKYYPSITTGANSTFTINGTTYTFPGGVGGAATQQTQNITLPGNSALTATYSVAAGGFETLSYTLGNPLPSNVYVAQSYVTNNKVYVIAGHNGTTWLTSVYTASINADGTIGAWSAGTSLPVGFSESQVIAVNSKIHLVGGRIAAGGTGAIYTASISGGLNDYSSYMNGDILPIEQFVTTSKFKLPDASFTNDNLNYFIKY